MYVNVFIQKPHHALRLVMCSLYLTCLGNLEYFAKEREQSRYWYLYIYIYAVVPFYGN